ncbi:hypothetical protein HA402_014546 [Bradysia odoriphaga]|nr:hypothetical protein HA402_014546 [Bradysia odoriphaga]
MIEAYCSRCIAGSSGEWYTIERSNETRKIRVDEKDLRHYVAQIKIDWVKIGEEWPEGVQPIYIKFEDLITQPEQEVKRVLAQLACNSEHVFFKNTSERQNPAPIHEKVTNYNELCPVLRDEKLDVKVMLQNIIDNNSIRLRDLNVINIEFIPDEEPSMPAVGWKYSVAKPYLPALAMQNVFDSMQSGSISSAGYWPKQLAARLRNLFRCPVAQPCSNGFTALMLAMQAANIGEGDEVIVPTMTMVAVPNAVRYLRGTPVFADNAKDSYNPMWTDYEKQATSKTKAVIVTHTYGVPASDIEVIQKNCKLRGWILIEDISECVGVMCTTSDGCQRLLGTFGDFSISSLYANKIVHGGDGGFVIAKDAGIGKRLASIVNHGFTPRFHFVHFEQAINAKIHGIGAAIASGCFDELEVIMKHRSQLSKWYRRNLRELPVKLMPQCGVDDTPWVFGVQCVTKSERTALRKFMAEHGIETRDFFFNLHLQPVYLPEKGSPPSLPNAEYLGSTGFYLPTHSNLTEEDVQYICDCMKLYFANGMGTVKQDCDLPLIPMKKASKACVQVEPNGFSLFVRTYRDTGDLTNIITRHVYICAVRLGIEAENVLLHETFDSVKLLLKNIKECISAADGYQLQKEMENFFLPYVAYYECQRILEQPLQRPWLSIDLSDSNQHHNSQRIPTTTDKETLQLLVWILHHLQPKIIWEIGSWMGHATVLMSEVCSHLNIEHKIFACDAFRWQRWMDEYFPKSTKYVSDSRSFLEVFQANVTRFSRHIQPVVWPYEIAELPNELKRHRAQLVFLDITQEDRDLEHIWSLIESALIPNETIVLFNGLTKSSIPFFTRHCDLLVPFLKPHSKAKAFRYVSNTKTSKVPKTYEDVEKVMQEAVPMKRNLKFYKSPAWDHHHNDLFCKSIEVLKQHLHSDQDDIIFFPAVEEALCDDIDLFFGNAWIGIIHGPEHYPELFYTPDLKRLCTNPKYIAALKNCKGLFTLTSSQVGYLRENLPDCLHKFPIQKIHYPIDIHTAYSGGSCVPQLIDNEKRLDVIHIGSYARDVQFFFQLSLPSKYRKVLLIGDEDGETIAENAPSDVTVLRRLSGDEYEAKLKSSVVLLTLKYGGAANTLLLECITRNIPILCPNMSSCTDYLGSGYPLLYESLKPDGIVSLLSRESITDAIAFLERMDKTRLSLEKFISDVKNGAVLLSLPPNPRTAITSTSVYDDPLTHLAERSGRTFKTYDVTICICSFKRTHNLAALLESLWNAQNFHGSFEIIIWNNNANRVEIVMNETKKYVERTTDAKSMVVINSSDNYYCSVRFSLPPLLKSNCVLICDDDILPGSNFISFFYAAHLRHPRDVLCVRGHTFLRHDLNFENPKDVWMNYENLKFKDDNQPEQLIHFVHADACLIPKEALQEVSSVSMPDRTFALVDDYWMSFVLSHRFRRTLRKLSVSGLEINPIGRTEDSDEPGLALHTRPEVQDARLRLYVHHMLQGWPKWETVSTVTNIDQKKLICVKNEKETFWNRPAGIGYNIHSEINETEISDLVRMGVKCVRIGAVGVREKTHFELSGFLTEPVQQLQRLTNTITHLQKASIDVVITLHRTLATPVIWRMIAEKFVAFENVVGYDLVNEPFTEHERNLHWADLQSSTIDTNLTAFIHNTTEIIDSIREVDQFTAIVLEPTFWGSIRGLSKFPIEDFLKLESNLVVSVHFYDPMTLTFRLKNKGRYAFPSSLPWYEDIPYSEETYWDEATVFEQFQKAKLWATEKGVRLFVGEFGICREINGAAEYLRAVINSCHKLNMTGLLFSYRDPNWDAMDYEFGTNSKNFQRTKMCPTAGQDNPLIGVILEGMAVEMKNEETNLSLTSVKFTHI